MIITINLPAVNEFRKMLNLNEIEWGKKGRKKNKYIAEI